MPTSETDYYKIAEFLMGDLDRDDVPMCRSTKKMMEDKVPLQSSPFKYYLQQVDRFLFSGGLSIRLLDEVDDDLRRDLLENFWKTNRLGTKLWSLLVRLSLVGELAVVPRYDPEKGYLINFYEKYEYKYDCDEDRLVIMTFKTAEGKKFIYRFDVTPELYVSYKLMPASKSADTKWEIEDETPHGYGELPVVIISNSDDLKGKRGKSDFDVVAIEMACQLMLQLAAASENFYFFGSPFFVSADPDDTLMRLKRRIRVLQKLPNEDGGGIDMLSRSGMPQEQTVHIDRLQRNLFNHLGINYHGADVKGRMDLSSLSLKMLNQDTISKAETKWSLYVDEGLNLLLNMIMRLAAVDGLLPAMVSPEGASLVRNKPYFSPTIEEKLQLAALAESLLGLGVDRVKALQLTMFEDHSQEEVEELMGMQVEGGL